MAAVLIFNTSSDQTLTGVISGNGVLTQSGVGTLKLTSANTYSGNTVINGGTLEIDSAGTLGVGGTYGGNIINVVKNT